MVAVLLVTSIDDPPTRTIFVSSEMIDVPIELPDPLKCMVFWLTVTVQLSAVRGPIDTKLWAMLAKPPEVVYELLAMTTVDPRGRVPRRTRLEWAKSTAVKTQFVMQWSGGRATVTQRR